MLPIARWQRSHGTGSRWRPVRAGSSRSQPWAPPRLCVHAVRGTRPRAAPEFRTDLSVCIACFDSIRLARKLTTPPLGPRAARPLAPCRRARGGPPAIPAGHHFMCKAIRSYSGRGPANGRSRSAPPPFLLLEAGHQRAHAVHLSRRTGAFKHMKRDRRMHPSFLRLARGA